MNNFRTPVPSIDRPAIRPWFRVIAPLLAAAVSASAAVRTPRDSYNEGVTKLQANELRAAESALLDAAKADTETVQPVALYNLGHVRFLQGKETLKGEGNRDLLARNSTSALDTVRGAIENAERVVEGDDLAEIIRAYMFGRSARKQLRAVREETARSVGLLETTRGKWKRSIGDFRGANELEPANTDATFNADVVERHLKELEKQLQRCKDGEGQMSEERQKLNELMKKLRGKIPKEMQRESEDEEGEDDEDEEQEPKKPNDKPSKQQTQRIGGEREIDPDMLRVLKEKVQNRTMSVGQEGEQPGERGSRPDGRQPGDPRSRKGKDW